MATRGYIGLISQNRKGKDTVGKIIADIVAPESSITIRFSDSLNRILTDDLKLPLDRALQQGLSTGVRREYGQDVLSKRVHQDALEADVDWVIINGVRRPADVKLLSPLPGFKLIAVDAPNELAYEWMKRANDREGDSEKTYEQFLKEYEAEPERLILNTASSAVFTIQNDEDDSEFKKLRQETERMLHEVFER